MTIQRRFMHGGLVVLAVLLMVGIAWAAPLLSIAPLGYRLVQVTQVPNQPKPTIEIVSRAGILNRGDPALKVSATLTSSPAGVTVLDGLVSFGTVPMAKFWPVTSHDTFTLRVVLPTKVNPKKPAQVYLFALSLLPKLNWSVSCDNCGGNQAPVSNAGADQTVYVGSLVTLDGASSTDGDGNALTYKWDFVSRPATSTATLSSSTAVRPTFTVDRPGNYVLQLVVNDGKQDSADTVTITTQNSAPAANAGADHTVDIGEPVLLNGTLSSDVDGDTLTYAWNLLSQPDGSAATLTNPGTAAPQFTPDVAGQYVVELVVDDGTVSSPPDTVVITTRPANTAPTANAGPDQTVPLGGTAQLDGSASSDPDAGDVLTFAWSLLSRPVDSTATLTAAGSAQPSFTVDKPGDYVAQLAVSDGKASVTDTVLVTTQNSPPTANAGTDQTIHTGSVVQLDGSQSADPDNDPLGFTWSLLNQPAGSVAQLSDPFAINPIFTADLPGLYTSQLIVNDGRSDSAPATVNTTATNTDPVAADDVATTPRDTPVVINVLGNDTDPDNDTLSVESVTTPAHGTAVILGTQVRYTPTAGFSGNDAFSYQISDGLGGTAAAEVTITVTFLDDSIPTAVLSVTPNPADLSATVTLDGSASTDLAPGTVVRYTFTLVSAPAGYVASNGLALGVPVGQDTSSRTFVPNVAGSYVLQLVVRDGGGNDSTAAAATLTVVSSDLAVGKTVSNAIPTVGTNVAFTVTLSNAGPTGATGVSVTDALPTGYAFVSADPTQGSYNGTSGAWTVGAVNNGASATLTITATVLATGNYTNTASLASSTPTDANSANNSASVVVTPVPVVIPNVTVPDVTGQSQTAATAALTSANLNVGTITQEASDTVAAGNIIRQSPAAGTSVARGSAVNIVVSSGPAPGGLPPDPATVAPPVNPTEITTIAGSTAFLYSGPTPIQTGVAPGTIAPTRAGVVRGRVLTASGAPLPGVSITIEDHPELGQTLSRADGMFDMVVNGGGLLSVNYQRAGYLSGQRQVNAPWQDFVVIDDVVLIQPDDRVTAIQAGATEFQVARGNPVTDSSGARQATVLFPPGTQATMLMPDGTTQPLATLSVRATEYTVGPHGVARMPGPLPPTSGYTYAVDLTADEALATGARDVTFNQPVPFYVENFLNFPVGIQVPSAYYDRDRSAWVPIPDGRVIRILAISGGLAEVDSIGNGVADNGAAIGMTVAERATLAQTYAAGRTLWRVQVTHFTPYDHNYGIVPPNDAAPPPPPPSPPPPPPPPPGGSCPQDPTGNVSSGNSEIDCQQQRLRESIAIVGTPFSLNYASDRVRGYGAESAARITVSGATVPASLRSIKLTITVAGQIIERAFPASPNQVFTFEWDGLNAFGQRIVGSTTATIRLDYLYDGYYALPPSIAASFGAPSSQRIPGDALARNGVVLSQTSKVNLVAVATVNAVGGWSLTSHYSYDPTSGEVLQGDGSRRVAQDFGKVITTVAGNGIAAYGGDGVLATESSLNFPQALAAGADGSLYIADGNNNRIRRVARDGTITTVAGGGPTSGPNNKGDGGPATSAFLASPYGVAVGADGSIFISEYGGQGIRRVGPDGIIRTVVGTGSIGSTGDGGPATSATLNYPIAVAVSADGTLYIAEYQGGRIRRVGPDGVISTVTVTGSGSTRPTAVAVGIDGNLLYSDGNRIRRVRTDGTIVTVAGSSVGYSGDGGLATAARLSFPTGIAGAADGSLFIADQFNRRIRRIGTNGIITTVAGNGTSTFSGDNGPATTAGIAVTYGGVAVGADGALFVSDYTNHRVRRVGSAFPGFSAGDIGIASESGEEIYQFGSTGRHLRTLNALTGATIYAFSYDGAGYLAAITDGDNNETTIERNADGDPLAIVGPDGQRTTLTLNGAGYIAAATNPAGEVFQASYDAGGRLTSFTKPRGQMSQYSYDSEGRLLTATNVDLYGQTLARTDGATGYQVNRTTALGRTTSYLNETLPAGGQRRSSTFPDGTRTIVQEGTDGRVTTTLPDGSSTNLLTGPDPRFAMQAPVPQSLTTTNGSLVSTLLTTRTAHLAAPGNPLSLTSLTEARTLNGRQSSSVYTAATRTWVTASPAGRQVTTVTDDQGRPRLSQVPGIADVVRSYDARGRLTTISQGTRVTQFSYDATGYLNSITDPLGRVTSIQNDPLGRPLQQTLPNGEVIRFAYDANGKLSSLTPPGRPAHTFDYTAGDLESVYRAPDLGDGQNATTKAYDLDRALDLVTLPGGQSINPSYDAAGRLASVTIGRGQYTYVYNATTGKFQSITAPDGGTLSLAYTGSLLLGQTWGGATAGSVTQTYANDFRIATQSVNGANTVAFMYDADSLLTQAGAMTLTPDPQNGLLRATALGTVTDAYDYSTFGEVSNYRAAAGSTELFNVTYQRDALGRITEKTEVVEGTSTTYAYSYDAAGQLTTVTRNGALISTYTYDSNGNRLTHVIPNGTTAATYDAQDRLLTYGNAAYTYTADGRLRTKVQGGQTTTYSYDELGNLLSVALPNGTTIEYLIDALNRRVGRKVNGVVMQRWLYEGKLQPVAELDATGSVVSRFVFGSRVNVPDYMVRGGVLYRIVADHLGSPRLIVDVATGQVVQRVDYDEWGEVVQDSNPGFQPFGFSGGLWDAAAALVRLGARDYEPTIGRWTAKDPIGFGGGEANLYTYTASEPINRVDPTGTEVITYFTPRSKSALECTVTCTAGLGAAGLLIGVAGVGIATVGAELMVGAAATAIVSGSEAAAAVYLTGAATIYGACSIGNAPVVQAATTALKGLSCAKYCGYEPQFSASKPPKTQPLGLPGGNSFAWK